MGVRTGATLNFTNRRLFEQYEGVPMADKLPLLVTECATIP